MNSVSSIIATMTTVMTIMVSIMVASARNTRSSDKVSLTVPVNITWSIETSFWVFFGLLWLVIPIIVILVFTILNFSTKMQTSTAEGTPGEDTEDYSRG